MSKKLGIYCWFYGGISSEQKYAMIRDAGFTSTSIWWGDEYEKSEGDKIYLLNLARKNGLDVHHVHAPYPSINSIWGRRSEECEHIVEMYLQCIKDCAKYCISTLVIHVDDIGFIFNEEYKQKAIERLNVLMEFAERLNIHIAIENYTSYYSIKWMLSNIASNKLGFCYDSGHENCFTADCDMLSLFGNRLFAIHLHDNNGVSDQHLLLQDGCIKWEQVKKKLNNYSIPNDTIFLEITDSCRKTYHGISHFQFITTAATRAKEIFL